MKKLLISLVVIIGLLFISNIAYGWKANFNYGRDTYEKWDNILIINSLGDETVESQFNYQGFNLGYNDYIPENAFKNNLYNEGYSIVYDFDNTPLDLTSVGYMGRLGDPRTYDEDYVLTSEYKKYSSQGQNVRIENNKGYILSNTKEIKKETSQRIKANKLIRKNVKRVENESIDRDNILQNNINDEALTRYNEDTELNNKIVDVDDKHTTWNKTQDTTLNDHENRVTDNTNRINDIDNRVNTLEETQVNIVGEIEFIRKKNFTVSAYSKYNVRHNKCSEVGVRFTIGLGKNQEQKELERLEQRINQLERK